MNSHTIQAYDIAYDLQWVHCAYEFAYDLAYEPDALAYDLAYELLQ